MCFLALGLGLEGVVLFLFGLEGVLEAKNLGEVLDSLLVLGFELIFQLLVVAVKLGVCGSSCGISGTGPARYAAGSGAGGARIGSRS